MYVCVCNAVNEKQVERAVAEGVTTLRELCRQHRVGASCGKCVPHARRVLDRALTTTAAFVEPEAITNNSQ